MKRLFVYSVVVVAMLMAGSNASAQSQGRGRDRARVERHERAERDRRPNNAARPDRGRHHDRVDRGPKHPKGHITNRLPNKGRLVRCTPPPHVRRGCYVPGWEGRVRYHHDGRWGYCVNGTWVYYDCYYNPYNFFCEPMPPRIQPSPRVYVKHASSAEVVAGVVAGTILGCILSEAVD